MFFRRFSRTRLALDYARASLFTLQSYEFLRAFSSYRGIFFLKSRANDMAFA